MSNSLFVSRRPLCSNVLYKRGVSLGASALSLDRVEVSEPLNEMSKLFTRQMTFERALFGEEKFKN